jgi:hypothetical protein
MPSAGIRDPPACQQSYPELSPAASTGTKRDMMTKVNNRAILLFVIFFFFFFLRALPKGARVLVG